MPFQPPIVVEGFGTHTTGKLLVAGMPAQVPFQVAPTVKLLPAHVTPERLEARVDFQHVQPVVAAEIERLLAHVTGKGLQPAVDQGVFGQRALQGEGFAADFTAVGLLAGVDEHVLLERVAGDKRLLAHLTGVRLVAGVDFQMFAQVGRKAEGFGAHLAGKGSLARVNARVKVQVVAIFKCSRAFITLKYGLFLNICINSNIHFYSI